MRSGAGQAPGSGSRAGLQIWTVWPTDRSWSAPGRLGCSWRCGPLIMMVTNDDESARRRPTHTRAPGSECHAELLHICSASRYAAGGPVASAAPQYGPAARPVRHRALHGRIRLTAVDPSLLAGGDGSGLRL